MFANPNSCLLQMRKASVVVVNKNAGNFEKLFESMKDRLNGVNNAIKKLREAAVQNDKKLHDLTASLRQHKDHIMSQVRVCYYLFYKYLD